MPNTMSKQSPVPNASPLPPTEMPPIACSNNTDRRPARAVRRRMAHVLMSSPRLERACVPVFVVAFNYMPPRIITLSFVRKPDSEVTIDIILPHFIQQDKKNSCMNNIGAGMRKFMLHRTQVKIQYFESILVGNCVSFS